MKRVPRRSQRTEAGDARLRIPELMAATLENALETYKRGLVSPSPARRVEAFKVEAWAASDDLDWPFSFLNVCRHVGVSPEVVRSCMAAWHREALGDEPLH